MRQANAFAPNWGQTIFQSANEMNQNLILKNQVAEIQGKLEGEKSWWENRRASIQSDFMKELETDGKPAASTQRRTGSDSDDAVLVETGGPVGDQGARKRKAKKAAGA